MENQTELMLPANDAEYFALDRMSNSKLDDFAQSPRHFLHRMKFKEPATPAMIFGSAFHCYVLRPDDFEKEYCCLPDDAPNKLSSRQINAKKPSPETLAAIAWWDEFNVANGGKIHLSPADMNTIKRMNQALYDCDAARDLLNALQETEVPMLWTDDVTGVEMKGKLDGGHDDFTLDLKTTMIAQPDSFAQTAFNNSMHRQAALYKDGRQLSGKYKRKGEFYFIAVEKEAPYGVSVNKCTDDFIAYGRMKYGEILEDYAYWCEVGSPDVCYEFKSPATGIFDLKLPYWVR